MNEFMTKKKIRFLYYKKRDFLQLLNNSRKSFLFKPHGNFFETSRFPMRALRLENFLIGTIPPYMRKNGNLILRLVYRYICMSNNLADNAGI